MTKVKIFNAYWNEYQVKALEDEMNNFIKDKEVQEVKQSVSYDDRGNIRELVCTIFYRDTNNKNIIAKEYDVVQITKDANSLLGFLANMTKDISIPHPFDSGRIITSRIMIEMLKHFLKSENKLLVLKVFKNTENVEFEDLIKMFFDKLSRMILTN